LVHAIALFSRTLDKDHLLQLLQYLKQPANSTEMSHKFSGLHSTCSFVWRCWLWRTAS